MKFSLIAAFSLIAILIGSCQNNPTNPNGNNYQNIIDSLGIDTNNTNCQFNYTYTYDSTNNIYTFVGQGSGVAPIQYVWVINQDTLYGQTVSVQGPVYDFCAAMLDDAGCFTGICDSIASQPNTCTTSFTVTYDSLNSTMTLSANGTGIAPYTYSWDINGVNYTGATVTAPNAPGYACLTQTDAGGCTATYCDSIGYNPTGGGNCGVQAWAYVDSTGNNMVTASANATGMAPFTYVWTVTGNQTTTYTGQTISWQGQSGITYQACVTIADNNGCSSTDCVSVTIP
ncbi:MAG: hypothetical protein KDC84_14480 [Crocinitomicaceae bacterium]|nr:hypothetical protein [Crocinitomicaceae bacterium]